ncbi:MAG: ABC transporter substrate-binding protein [Polyangiales bacterium]
MSMKTNWRVTLPLLALLAGAVTGRAHAEDKPSVIRLAFPGVGVGNRPVNGNSALATAHLKGLFEEEFKKDGIKITWSHLRGAGPAMNELYANRLVDFSTLGDLPSVIGRSSGLRYRLLAASTVRSNIYVSVPADSPVESVAQLKGKRIAVNKGTATHLAGLKILEKHGLTDKDVKLINMDTNAAQLALATRDIDAALGGQDYLRLRDQGIARVVFTTRGGPPEVTSNSSFLGNEDFITKYPEITKRVLKVYVQASKYVSETTPTQLYQLWAKSGTTFSSYREDLQSEDFKNRYSPLIDPYIHARYALQIGEAKRLGLIRAPFEFTQFIEPKFLQAALKELNLESYWLPRGPDGKFTKSVQGGASVQQEGQAATRVAQASPPN